MDHLLGTEERELRFLVAEHCHDIVQLPSQQQQQQQQQVPNNNTNQQQPTRLQSSSSASSFSSTQNLQHAEKTARGDLSHAIALVLAQMGWTPAIDIFEALKHHNSFSSALASSSNPAAHVTEDAVRAELRRLMLHGIVRHDPRTGRYGLDVVVGVLRLLFPLMAQPVIKQLGAISETVLHILYQQNDLPLPVLANLVSDALPQLSNQQNQNQQGGGGGGVSVIDRVIREMQLQEWIVQVSSNTAQPVNNQQQQQQQQQTSQATASLIASFGINYAKFLANYRSHLIVKYICENMSAAQRSICSQLATKRQKEQEIKIGSSAEENTAFRLPFHGQEVPTTFLTSVPAPSNNNQNQNQTQNNSNVATAAASSGSNHNNNNIDLDGMILDFDDGNNSNNNNDNNNQNTGGLDNNTKNAIRSLALDQPRAVVQVLGNLNDLDRANCRFSFENAVARARLGLMCCEVRVRFGLMGQRVVKILLDHKALEDKNIAEEGLIDLTSLHQLLLNMQGEGIVGIQELLKTPGASVGSGSGNVSVTNQIAANSGPDRSTKQSIFLWRLQERNLLALLRIRVCKSICALRVRMRSEWQQLGLDQTTNSSASASSSANNNNSMRVPPNSAANSVGSMQKAARQRFDSIQEHFSKSLLALYEQIAISVFF